LRAMLALRSVLAIGRDPSPLALSVCLLTAPTDDFQHWGRAFAFARRDHT
jgi:hypothetical protein